VAALALVLPVCASGVALAQTATVTLSSQKQFIRGFGGMSHAAWAGDLTAAERTLAFGNGTGQLGFTALRIPVTDGSPDSANVATAKAAIAAGAIVFATPWNAAGNMSSSQFASYATHLNNFVSYMKGQGVDLYAISVQNEPDYGAQSGWMAWTAALCHDFVLNYGAMITTKLISCESFNYSKSYYDPILNDAAALANVDVLGTHLYGTPVSGYPYPLFDSKASGQERWMTEHYTDSTTDADSWPNALGVATELHHAMVDGQFNLYTWWYIVRSYGPIKTNGAVSKRGWCMAHFSKFIRPGYHRVDATATPMSGVYLSAYKGDSDIVVVIVNTNSAAASLNVSIAGSTASSFDRFTTSASKNLSNDGKVTASNGALTVSLDGQSVTTLHAGGAPTTGAGGAGASGGAGGSVATGGSLGSGGRGGTAGGRGGGGAAGATVVTGAGGVVGTGGAIATGGAVGSGGVVGTGGAVATGGAVGSGGATGETSGEAGCACGLAGQSAPRPLWLALTVFAAAALARRRRAGRR